MQDFRYYNPTQIEFGKDKENLIGDYIKENGFKKVLLVTGMGSIKLNGLYDRVIDSLSKNDIIFCEVDKVVSNPVLSKVNQGIEIAKKNKVEAVLAVGGGSVADSAKAIALGVLYDGDVWDFYSNKAQVERALPIFTIMTLAATASEMNGNSVITKESTKQKYSVGSVHLNPKLSIVNPDLMSSVSSEYLAYSAVDIIAHSIEVYFTASHHPNFNSLLVESIIKSVIDTTEKLIKNPSNYEARGEFAWVAINALNGLLPSGTANGSFPNHMIEHSISALFNIAHGAGLSIVIPAWMKWHKNYNIAQYERFAKNIFNVNSADEGIIELENWFKKIGSPILLEDVNIPKKSIREIAVNANELASLWGIGDIYQENTIVDILNNA